MTWFRLAGMNPVYPAGGGPCPRPNTAQLQAAATRRWPTSKPLRRWHSARSALTCRCSSTSGLSAPKPLKCSGLWHSPNAAVKTMGFAPRDAHALRAMPLPRVLCHRMDPNFIPVSLPPPILSVGLSVAPGGHLLRIELPGGVAVRLGVDVLIGCDVATAKPPITHPSVHPSAPKQCPQHLRWHSPQAVCVSLAADECASNAPSR